MVQENGSQPDSETEDVIRWSAGGLYAGAADTVGDIQILIRLSHIYQGLDCICIDLVCHVDGIASDHPV